MDYATTKKTYTEILEKINKFKDFIVFDYKDLEFKSKCHLFGIELEEKYGLKLEPRDIRSLDYNNFCEYRSIGWYGEKYRRTISWSDDGKQPEDELLLVFGFSTGAYIFGDRSDDDYPTEFFKEFFQELKAYNPKYTDTTNKNLYFSMENAGKIFNEFPEILKKYYEKNKEDLKLRKIKKMEDAIKNLKES